MFRQIIKFANASGWIAGNPSDAVTIRTKGERRQGEEDAVTIPPKDQLRALYEAARSYDDTGQAEALVAVLMFGGLRISELLGLSRRSLFLTDGNLKIIQRADRWLVLGPVKTKAARRSVPLPPTVIQALKKWLPNAPVSKDGLGLSDHRRARGGRQGAELPQPL